MELRLLRYFVTVAEELHFTRAAARLNMAQPPLSQQIRRLEEEIGVKLLVRTKRKVELTEPGRQFMLSAIAILAQVDHAILQTQRTARGEVGRITLGMVSVVAVEGTLPRILRAYREQYPGVSIALQEMSPVDQLAALKEGRIQVAFLPPPDNATDLTITPFYREPLVAVLPDEHPLSRQESIPLKALENEHFIIVPRNWAPGGVDRIFETCRQAGFTPRISQEAQEFQSIFGYVAAGFGISMVPWSSRKQAHSGVTCVALSSPGIFVEIAAVHRALDDSPLLASFMTILREAVA